MPRWRRVLHPQRKSQGCKKKPLIRHFLTPDERLPRVSVGLLRNYCQQARKTAELAELLTTARESTREINDRPLPRQNTLHRSVVKLLIEDYEAGASTYELAKRYNLRRNTVRDTLRRAGFDLTAKSKRAALSEEQKAEARRLFANGTTRRKLMEMYGVSESTIRRVLRCR